MASFKTIRFLPEIFRTDTNKKFVNSTIDQLVSEPNLVRVNGYIGRKFSPSYKPSDSYISELTKNRQDYQLEPSIVIKDSISGELLFTTTYIDIVNKINFYGGFSDNHSRLFDNEFYSYNPQIDLDKFVNYSQYYWLANGPDAVLVGASAVPLEKTYDVTYDSVTQTYQFTEANNFPNPILTLARGGTYTFNINEPNNKFYIQTSPGVLGVDPYATNLSTRNVLGVTNNGQDVGSITFKVPTKSAQVQWSNLSVVDNVNYATNLSYQSLQGSLVSELNDVLGGIDGVSSSLEGITLIFVNNGFIDDIFWHNTARIDSNIIYLDQDILIPLNERNDIYQINLYFDDDGNQRIYLTNKFTVNNEQKVRINAGVTNAGKEFYSRLNLFNEVPAITAPLNLLYYQSDTSDNAVGAIQLVDLESAFLDPGLEIIGQQYYTSPGGIVFSNGLKVSFDSSAVEPYANNTYYVEGVGTSIQLVPIGNLIGPELDNNVSTPDYLTINRSSIDLNGWSRTNRWFHVEIIEKTAQYNSSDLVLDQNLRAQRPIIEFTPNLQLNNFGTQSKDPVDVLDYIITNAFLQVQGVLVPIISGIPTELTVTIGDKSVTFTDGDRIIFSQDENLEVRNKIYNFSIEKTANFPPTYRAYIEEAADAVVEKGHTLIVKTGDNGSKQWYFNGSTWVDGQQKTSVNQAPLFDVINDEGLSYSDISVFPGTQFIGTKIFSYKQGTGPVDPVLGFPLSYKNLNTQGDIQFENNFDLDTFDYIPGAGITETLSINSGLLQKNISRTVCTRLNTWVINSNFSKQYQIFNFVYDGSTNLFPIDILPENSTTVPNIKVLVNKTQILNTKFGITKAVDKLAVFIDPSVLTVGDVIFISIFNNSAVSNQAYYQVPLNFDINSLNTDLEILTLGQMRNHLIEFKNNSLNVLGDVPGKSNLRDLSYFNKTGNILQHSAPLIYAGLFLNHPTMNFVDSINLATREYSKFKIKFLELAVNLELDRTNIAECVDIIMANLNEVKNDSFPWHFSDMVPHGDDNKTILPSYTIFDSDIKEYEITNIFNDTLVSNKAVLVYITRTIDGVTTTELLVKGKDYVFNQNRPAITILDTFNLLINDILTIVEYSNTDGSYVPETPTKLGLYPKFVPELLLDNTYLTPINVIQGHDGSLTPAFNDFRDQLLLELERRIYNNIKTTYDPISFNINDYFPGKWRLTDYSLSQFNQLLSQSFLKWVGNNRVDFTTNKNFVASNPFSWNYKKFRDVVNGESLPGTWRSIFRYFFDTDRPHTHPWEMLGFSEKPEYWNDRYGPAPYTGGNFLLWSDLEAGYIHQGPRAGIDLRYSRPRVLGVNGELIQRGLTDIIPVDDSGNLRNPSEFLVTDFNSLDANASYSVGDIGPAELAWRRSSDYPFAVQTALAIGKPAKYFSLLIDVQNYKRSEITGQFVTSDGNLHLQPNLVKVNGNSLGDGTFDRSAGYINWIRDYVKNIGIANSSELIKDNLNSITVQLSYKMAGFSDKRFLELLAEQVSPSSINDSIVVPEENYGIFLYQGSPIRKLTYSAVNIEKTANGYSVSGYNSSSPFFLTIPSLPNNNSYNITANGQRAKIYKDFKKQVVSVPYGFEFNTKQQVVDFLVSYQRHLVSQGFQFDDRDNLLSETKDWILSAKEFLFWSTQGWKSGNIIVLSPVSSIIKIFDTQSVVDEVANTPTGSRVLDINYRPISKNNFTTYRENNVFKLQSNRNQSIGLAEFNLVQIEHILILDNSTVFNDIIYLPETGNRQFRLKLIGAKTGSWNGSLELPGYIYSSEFVEEWQPGKDYLKGQIVKNKSLLYTALENIVASDQFQSTIWKQLNQNELKSGMINNLSTNASQALQFYDINDQPLEEEIQLFSNGLIGFRPRQYLTNLGIDNATQSKFYQGFIKQSGTINAINALKGAKFNNLSTDLNFYENWAVRVGEYGALDINDFFEFILSESEFDNNPAVFQLIDESSIVDIDIKSFEKKDIYKLNGSYRADFFRTESLDEPVQLKPLPTAGFVNIDDVDIAIYDLLAYEDYNTLVNNIGVGYTIWTAKDVNNQWNVFRASNIPGIAIKLRYNIDDQAELSMSANHGLSVNDLIVLKNFDALYNGVYKVNAVVDSKRILITISKKLANIPGRVGTTFLQYLIGKEEIIGQGIVYQLNSSKLSVPIEASYKVPNDGWITGDKIWVENLDLDGNWGVFDKIEPWYYQNKLQLGSSQYSGNDHFGRALVLDPTGLYLYGGAPDSSNGRVSVYARNVNDNWDSYGFLWGNNTLLDGYGKTLATATTGSTTYLVIGAPESDSNRGVVYVYKNQVLIQILADPAGTANDNFGSSLAISDNGDYLYIGASGANKVFCYSLSYSREEVTQSITGSGASSFNLNFPASSASDVIVTSPLSATEYFPEIDYTVASGPDRVIFTIAPAIGERIIVQKRDSFYKLLDTLPINAESIAGSGFGSSLACNSTGTIIAVGASNTEVDGVINEGAVYIYHRTVTEITTTGISNTFTFPNNLNSVYRVYINNELQYDLASLDGYNPNNVSPTYFVIGTNSIQYGGPGIPSLGPGNVVRIESNQFVLDQIVYSQSSGLLGNKFGTNLAMCNSGCNLYITSPNYSEPSYSFGIVTRFVNIGRVYGTIIGTVVNPTVTAGQSVIINNRYVEFTGISLDDVINDINNANIPGVIASNKNSKLQITSNVNFINDKLNIVSGSAGTPLIDLGIEQYKYVQIIKHPQNIGETFGAAVKVDQASNTLVVGSDGADIQTPTFIDNALGSSTIFDSTGTTFIDVIKDSGAVYVYNLMNNPYEDQDNPSLFAFTQKLTGSNIDTGANSNLATGFNFGAALDIKGDTLIVGVSNDYGVVPDGGSLYYYFNEKTQSGWNLIRYKQPRVDIGAVTSSFLYNTVQQSIIDFFDYYDPVKGKLLGVVEQELDYKELYDPASYNNSNRSDTVNNKDFYWYDRQVGRTWWDLSTVRYIDYEQDSLTYRSKNWGELFPGSKVAIYEWVETNFLPSQYVAAGEDGVPKYTDDSAYSVISFVDPATGIISQKYYYWVSGKNTVDTNVTKRLISVKKLESYITNPKDQNIPYLGLLAPNAVAVYNVVNKLSGNDVAIHFDIANTRNPNLIHNEWQLVQQNAGAESIPSRVIKKLKDSLVGLDNNGLLIPDPYINLQDRFGILDFPRQSLVINRIKALKEYVGTLNNVFKNYPILLISNPSLLLLEDPLPTKGYDDQTDSFTDLSYLDVNAFPDGYKILIPADSNYDGKWSIYNFNSITKTFELYKLQSFKTTLFWEPLDWYGETYQNGKDIDYVVQIYSEIQALNLQVGEYVQVLDNGQNKWILYEVLPDFTLDLIGAQDGTLQLKTQIYDVSTGSGYDSAVYDSQIFDPQAIQELQNIYDSVYSQILIGNLSFEFNKLFLTIINYIFAEQKNPDWIFKTSFIDVYHNLRTLEQFPSYVRDNQSFYNDYIQEIKPYRTQIREYVPKYFKEDVGQVEFTDFDLPSSYDDRFRVFRSPNILNPADTTVFTEDLYKQWANNYKFKITDFIIGNVGLNYSVAPKVEITGGGGTGFEALAQISANGKVTGITIINPGSGFTTTPNVFINGDGEGATAYPLLKNEFYSSQANLSYNLVRSIDAHLKFDRLSYSSNVVNWQPNTAYANSIVVSGNITTDSGNIYLNSGNIVIYNNQAYLATNANVTTESIFDFTRFNKIESGNVLLDSLDRILAYYEPTVGMPGKNIKYLQPGITYPKNLVGGPAYRANVFNLTSNIISFNYEGLTINSGNIAQIDFIKLGFEINKTILVEAQVPFAFQNNGFFTIVNVNRSSMTLTGQPVETTYKITFDTPITANAGDYVTQANNSANAFVLQSVINSTSVSLIYSTPSFEISYGNVVSINGLSVNANITDISTGGNLTANISYIDQDIIIDSNIYSTYLDTELGTRPQDINIVGGSYVDVYNSHAPEELIPGRIFDTFEMRVFSNTVANTQTYGFRIFKPMSANISYSRISANSTTTLSSNLSLNDDEILVNDIDNMTEPNPSLGKPGVIFINGEKITYYQKYDAAKLAAAIPWTANTVIGENTLISLDGNTYLTSGNVYANANIYISSSNIQLIKVNSLRQIRRGVDGTGVGNLYNALDWSVYSYKSRFIDVNNYNSFSIAGDEPKASGIYFRSDGVKMYLTGQGNDNILEYTLGTAWDITTASNVGAFSIQTQDNDSTAIYFKNDGSRMYMVGKNTPDIHEYEITIPWQVNSSSYYSSFTTNVIGNGIQSLTFSSNGSSLYFIDNVTSKIHQYTLTNNWQTNSAAFYGFSANIENISGNTNALVFDDTGNSFYILNGLDRKIYEYELETAYDITSNITLVSNSSTFAADGSILTNLFWQYQGRKVYTVDQTLDTINEHNITIDNLNNIVSDSSGLQLIPNAQVYSSSTVSGNIKTTSNVSFKLTLSSTISANIGDYITQFGNTGNARVLESVTNSNVIAVDFVTGVFQTSSNLATRINLVSIISGITNTSANVISQNTLGSIFANGNVVLSSVPLMRSNIWEEFGNTLQYSSTIGAQFIRAEPSYLP